VCSTAAGVQGGSAVSPRPHFEKTTCTGTLAQDDKAGCRILSVPENRSSKKSRTIHLPVVILHSHAPGAPRGAVLFMTGGPGLSSRILSLWPASGSRVCSHREKAPALDCVLAVRGLDFAAQPRLE